MPILTRRHFLQGTGTTALSLGLAPLKVPLWQPNNEIRIACVGVRSRGGVSRGGVDGRGGTREEARLNSTRSISDEAGLISSRPSLNGGERRVSGETEQGVGNRVQPLQRMQTRLQEISRATWNLHTRLGRAEVPLPRSPAACVRSYTLYSGESVATSPLPL